VEDTHTSMERIREIFGPEVEALVDGVTKISKITFSSNEEKQAENFRKMILAMTKDIRVILVKLADRLHNMRTLQYVPEAKRRRVSRETIDIYAPIANRLGINWMKVELEDRAFAHLSPKAYADLQSHLQHSQREREGVVNELRELIGKAMAEAGVPGHVEGRSKHLYSIYNKMLKQSIDFEQVYDISGVRIITDTVRRCYSILGILHSLWKPVPGRFKDYIAMPKSNMYQSLHTTIIGTRGEPVEFQIRTEEMHRIAEEGIAAHWRYKEGKEGEEREEKQFVWLRELLEWQQEVEDPREFMETVRVDLFPDEVYVFTPKGDVKALPQGATPVDFAYSVHTEVGNLCVGAKVNGKMVALKTPLKNGDIVEILTDPRHQPSRDWLKFAKTARAREKIRVFVKAEQKKRALSLGEEIFQKELKKYGLEPSAALKDPQLLEVAKRFGCQRLEDLLVQIGYGKVSVRQVALKLLPEEQAEALRLQEMETAKEAPPKKPRDTEGVKVKGVEDILLHFAKCCNPVPGDEIIGYVTRGRGVSVHTADCPSLKAVEVDPERRIGVEWDVTRKKPHLVRILVETVDKPGVLAKVTSAIADSKVNISECIVKTTEDQQAQIHMSIEIIDLEHLEKVMREIGKVKTVLDVRRIKESAHPRRLP
jgi:guanosine-3',5'-bis(diphosphate) 3'-pyrophosphohydrolase